jgi:acyl-CoA thioester hydrolase
VSEFSHEHLVQLYETDLMGIVHHANYLRFLEESRVAWATNKGLLDYQKIESASHLAVYGSEVRHIQPAFFGDRLRTFVQAKIKGVKIIFEYKTFCINRDQTKSDVLVLEGRTTHVPLNKELKLIRPPIEMKKIMENEKWIETWLLNL